MPIDIVGKIELQQSSFDIYIISLNLLNCRKTQSLENPIFYVIFIWLNRTSICSKKLYCILPKNCKCYLCMSYSKNLSVILILCHSSAAEKYYHNMARCYIWWVCLYIVSILFICIQSFNDVCCFRDGNYSCMSNKDIWNEPLGKDLSLCIVLSLLLCFCRVM